MIAYLLASLPTPRLGAVPLIEPATFLERCRGFVSDVRWHDLAEVLGEAPDAERPEDESLATLDLDDEDHAAPPEPPHPRDAATRAWADLAAQVEDAVTLRRASRARRDPRAALRRPTGFRFDVVEGVARAFERPHPGARERALDELRWRLADELSLAHPGEFGALLAHAAQLRLAWRWAQWSAEDGLSALEAALRRIEGSLA
jgi:hypothetical protein